jgi:hypothetical protein
MKHYRRVKGYNAENILEPRAFYNDLVGKDLPWQINRKPFN